jgi:TolB-like protein
MPENRKLAAILSADVVGFSRLAASDEDRTLARLRALRSDLIDPTIAVHNGRVVKRTGDGVLVEFRSVVDAVRCAVEVQNAMVERNAGLRADRRIEFRIGIHLGDVVEESDGDLMGDGVNIAARLEGLAEPGAICLSEDAFRQVRSRLDMTIDDLGETRLKNIVEPIRVYALRIGIPAERKRPAATQDTGTTTPSVPDRPSIAVVPFVNMSGDPEQEYFADGVVEDIITALSRFRQLFVIARNSSFAYKGRSVDVKQIGRELGVRYLLEGSVRKAGDRLRITGQLIDTATGTHLWADRFDGRMADIFDLQDQITASVVGAVAPRLEQAEIERAKRKPTESLDAYDHYLRGMAAFHRFERAANCEALQYFMSAVELDADFGAALGMAARCYAQRKGFGWLTDPEAEATEARRLARLAASAGRDDAVALGAAGFTLVMFGDTENGAALTDKALAINPNLAWARHIDGFAKAICGEADAAVEQASLAMRLSPQDAQTFAMQAVVALGHFLAGRDEEAYALATAAMLELPNFPLATGVVAASAAYCGHEAEAARAIARLREQDPTRRLSNLSDWFAFRRAEDMARWSEGLRRAGLAK